MRRSNLFSDRVQRGSRTDPACPGARGRGGSGRPLPAPQPTTRGLSKEKEAQRSLEGRIA